MTSATMLIHKRQNLEIPHVYVNSNMDKWTVGYFTEGYSVKEDQSVTT